MKKYLLMVIIFILGLIGGAFIFRNVQPRGVLNIKECANNCFKTNEYTGIVGSAIMQNFPGLLPNKLRETDKTIVINYPGSLNSKEKIHYVAIPKYDIKNLGQYTSSQKDYLDDAMQCFAEIINDKKLDKYQIYSYGPGLQDVAYWHFHLVEFK